MNPLILVLIAFALFIIYNVVICVTYGIPTSLSVSFYLLNSTKKGLGYVFTGFMFVMALLLMPAWIQLSEVVSSWSHNCTFLAFLACGSIAFVGAAPAFRSCPLESKVHSISAKLAAAFSILWCGIVCYKLLWLLPIAFVVSFGIAFLSKTLNKTYFTYWIELVAFLYTFSTITLQYCLL